MCLENLVEELKTSKTKSALVYKWKKELKHQLNSKNIASILMHNDPVMQFIIHYGKPAL